MEFLNCNTSNYRSCLIVKNKKYPPQIVCKIKTVNERPVINIKYSNPDYYLKTIYDLQKKSYIIGDIQLGKIWMNNAEEYSMSLFIDNIYVI